MQLMERERETTIVDTIYSHCLSVLPFQSACRVCLLIQLISTKTQFSKFLPLPIRLRIVLLFLMLILKTETRCLFPNYGFQIMEETDR